jgi:hypothetical protein
MGLILWLSVPAYWFCLPHIVRLAQEPVPVDERDLEVKLELVGSPPAPLQAIRVRLSVRNVSDRKLGPLMPVDSVYGALIKGPSDDGFRSAPRSVRAFGGFGFIGEGGTGREQRNRKAPLFLEPGEQTSVTWAFAAGWKRKDSQWIAEPIFSEEGKYRVKAFYPRASQKYIERVITIEVPAPQGDDAKIVSALQKQPDLLSTLLNQFDPAPKDVAAELVGLVRLYPKSSYAPYARLALARFRMNQGSEVQFAAAATELEEILHVPFAYQPNAWMRLAKADENKRERVNAYMNLEHRDALEWLEFKAADLKTPAEWQAFRKYRSQKEKKDEKRSK